MIEVRFSTSATRNYKIDTFTDTLLGKSHDSEAPRRTRTVPTQSSTLISVRTAFLVLTLIAVALATTKAPSVKIVIRVPANFVGNGSKIFFNEDFHGRLLLSRGFRAKMNHFQQFGKFLQIILNLYTFRRLSFFFPCFFLWHTCKLAF